MSKINAAVKENRKKLFINHIVFNYKLIDIIFNTFYCLEFTNSIEYDFWSKFKIENYIDKNTFCCITFTSYIFESYLEASIFLLIRLREPYFRSRTRLFFDTLTCKRKWKENKEYIILFIISKSED